MTLDTLKFEFEQIGSRHLFIFLAEIVQQFIKINTHVLI
jgi:hypothetical protein